jgi:glyoxylase-like metal-dependent hydrolase (beta-lactamase superfamily II)
MKLNRISPHVYWTLPEEDSDRPILGAVVGRSSVLMVEAGASADHAAEFLSALSLAGLPFPKYAALTHWHWDHVFGLGYLDLPVFAHADTAVKIREMAGLDWGDAALDKRVFLGQEIEFCQVHMKVELSNEQRKALVLRTPEITYQDQVSVDLGGVTCRMIHVGGDHSPDSSVVFIPEDKVIFTGDCLYTDLHHNPPRYTSARLFPLVDRLLGLETDFYLEAHNPEPVSLAAMVKQAALFKAIGRKVDKRGPDRPLILGELNKELSEQLVSENLDIVDGFIAGLAKK